MELSGSNIKNFFIFFQNKTFPFLETETKLSSISVSSFPSSKKFLIFWEMEFSDPRKLNKTFLYPKIT